MVGGKPHPDPSPNPADLERGERSGRELFRGTNRRTIRGTESRDWRTERRRRGGRPAALSGDESSRGQAGMEGSMLNILAQMFWFERGNMSAVTVTLEVTGPCLDLFNDGDLFPSLPNYAWILFINPFRLLVGPQNTGLPKRHPSAGRSRPTADYYGHVTASSWDYPAYWPRS